MPRDFQRAKVYAAENASPDGPAFFSLMGMQSFVDRITRTRFWRNRAPLRYWSIKIDSYAPSKGCEDDIWVSRRKGILYIPHKKDGTVDPIAEEELIHDLCHFLAPMGHGPEFVRHLIDLTRRFHSMPTRARVLSERLVDLGVQVKPKYRMSSQVVKPRMLTTAKKTR
jgi:hypothetical protein